jgi:hypothetical protein
MDNDFEAAEAGLAEIYWRRFRNRWHVEPVDLPPIEMAIIADSLMLGNRDAAQEKPIVRFASAYVAYLILRGIQAFREEGKNAEIRQRGENLHGKVMHHESVLVLSDRARTSLAKVGYGFLQARGML